MRPFIAVTKPIYGDFFSILEMGGVKYIHTFGYIYDNGDVWSLNEVSRFFMPLAYFVKEMNTYEDKWDYIDELYEACPQYYDEYPTEEACTEAINHFFDGKPADSYLSFTDITEDTPCGNYIDLGR